MIRRPAVAGTFYPSDAAMLRQVVSRLLETAEAKAGAAMSKALPKALIVPHAGYAYSGAVAGQAYARLAAHAGTIRRVILLGPVHRVPVHGLALPEAGRFATPLGEVPIDADAVSRIAGMPQVVVSAAAHEAEHSLEVQLPFLQSILGDFTLVPLAVGDATAAEVAEVLDTLWGGPETLIVISSDLSHFLPYDAANDADRNTIRHIMNGDLLESYEQACGALPINGLLLAACRHGLEPKLVSFCNSGDTSGDHHRVVGYAAIEFLETRHG